MLKSKSFSRRGLSLALAFMLSASVLGHAFADDVEDLENQLDSLQQQAEVQQEITNQAAAKVDNITEKLKDIQLEVASANKEYNEVSNELNDVEARISGNTEVLESTDAELKEKQKKLNRRIRDIYINGRIGYIDVLFGAKDFSDFMTRLDLLSRIIKRDYQLVMKVYNDRNTVIKARSELEKDKLNKLILVNDADYKLTKLNDKKAVQKELLYQAENDRDTSEAAYNDLIAASNEIANLIRNARAARESGNGGEGDNDVYVMPSSGGGSMIWPISGEITSEYGWRVHPIFGTSRYHSGLDIGGDWDEPIVAAAAGVVMYAGWVSGYGYTVIIDHGGGVTTLYGHNDELLVDEGEAVAQGQTIALCGSTGNSTGPHCHFEVREDGEPVSPYDYF